MLFFYKARGKTLKLFLLILCAICCSTVIAEVVPFIDTTSAASSTEALAANDHITIYAKDIVFLQNIKKVIAQGNVMVTQILPQGERVLYCDSLEFDYPSNHLTIKGNVKLKEADGTVAYADAMDLTTDFQSGTINALKIVGSDSSERFRASKGQRADGNITVLQQADYTPCKICTGKSPTWELTAEKIIHDEQNKIISYQHVFLKMKGIKIFYWPYFSHPDPTVKRKSGFLMPVIGSSNNLGQFVHMPYYYVISDQQDFTFTPILMTKQSPILMGEYRQRFNNGLGNLGGSITTSKHKKKTDITIPSRTRWHLNSLIDMDLDDSKHMIIDINRASDTNYINKYKLNKQPNSFARSKNLNSKVQLEKYSDKTYAVISSEAFQTDNHKITPFLLPQAKVFSAPLQFNNGATVELTGDCLSIIRKESFDASSSKKLQRLSFGSKVNVPKLFDNGQLIKAMLNLRGDCYNFQGLDFDKTNSFKSTGRLFSQAGVEWSYPLRYRDSNFITEPKVSVITSPNQASTKYNIPNEDSRVFTLDESNIFAPNRFDGIDRVDAGSRLVYGVNNTWFYDIDKNLELFLGYTKRLDNKQVLDPIYGENNRISDYITSISWTPHKIIQLKNRAAISYDTKKPRYNELGVCVGKPVLLLDLSYIYTRKNLNIAKAISQVNAQISSKISDNWQLSFAQIRNLQKKTGGILGTFAAVTYQDDCFTLKFSVYRNNTQDRDIKKETGFLLQLVFKNLGSFSPFTTSEYPGSSLTKSMLHHRKLNS